MAGNSGKSKTFHQELISAPLSELVAKLGTTGLPLMRLSAQGPVWQKKMKCMSISLGENMNGRKR